MSHLCPTNQLLICSQGPPYAWLNNSSGWHINQRAFKNQLQTTFCGDLLCYTSHNWGPFMCRRIATEDKQLITYFSALRSRPIRTSVNRSLGRIPGTTSHKSCLVYRWHQIEPCCQWPRHSPLCKTGQICDPCGHHAIRRLPLEINNVTRKLIVDRGAYSGRSGERKRRSMERLIRVRPWVSWSSQLS